MMIRKIIIEVSGSEIYKNEKIDTFIILLNGYDKSIEQNYKNSLKEKAEKEMLDLLAS